MSDVKNDDNESLSTPLRDDLVQKAVSFLQNPRVASQPLAQKQKFLQRKGLQDEEIKKACEISGAYKLHEQGLSVPPPLPPSIPQHYNYYGGPLQISLFDKVKEIVHNIAVFSVVGYAIWKFYENYIAPYLFGKKKKSVEASLEELDKNLKSSIEDLRNNITSVRIEVDKLSQSNELSTVRQLNELKSDVATVKGILLNKKQFSSVNNPVVPPSIPAWQLLSSASGVDSDNEHKNEELEDVGSGSGSSEPEHYNTKTSESSLEIIYTPKDSDTFSQKSKEED